MTQEKPSVRVEFDSTRNSIVFWVDASSQPLGTWDLSIALDNASELEEAIGYIVLAALSNVSGQSIGIRDYRVERGRATPLILEHFMKRLQDGDEGAVISMVNELISAAVRHADPQEIDRADRLLQDAARAGNAKAIQYLQSGWAKDKEDFNKLIRRR